MVGEFLAFVGEFAVFVGEFVRCCTLVDLLSCTGQKSRYEPFFQLAYKVYIVEGAGRLCW